jgi:hypothetical protein
MLAMGCKVTVDQVLTPLRDLRQVAAGILASLGCAYLFAMIPQPIGCRAASQVDPRKDSLEPKNS